MYSINFDLQLQVLCHNCLQYYLAIQLQGSMKPLNILQVLVLVCIFIYFIEYSCALFIHFYYYNGSKCSFFFIIKLGLLWKIYSGYKKSTQQSASIFVLEKRQLDKWSRIEREHIIEVVKKGVAQLARLKHPQILTVQHTLEESRFIQLECIEC